ncbi:uncharacterized protein E0L32_009241 [Thyridium curvatum]|uniref:histidine--tRNA ligase n=1 Tax=Thyridium curvatum TaxID=1093900 RepID=A0A507AXE6_9PEZI|nr:uncharacterized protein E0L32_009241 [Thyridium curvatum]TPX09498.1 hypothetical protein E0L32_009241 [Thyridium curvatum]
MASQGAVPLRPAFQLKTPKGTRDWSGRELHLRECIFRTASEIFELHGAIPLDTPVFELRDILAGKYGEEARLIYNLEDQGGELCSLRYDLTVPFARWLAMHSDVKQVKRYQIAKVYRRDQPAISRGRLREFYQCDFDIAGSYDPMVPDAEVLRVVVDIFHALELDITIKINHRQILDGIFDIAGVPADKTRTISSAVDKLDKSPWDEVKKEMVDEKDLPKDVADRIGEYVQRSGSMSEMLASLKTVTEFCDNPLVKSGLDDMTLLMSYLEAMNIIDKVSFDLSLARGLDYYSGLIYEVIPQTNGSTIQVGSIAAGGRYDGLVGMYGKQPVPCVGVSLGIDRIFTILDARETKKKSQKMARDAEVFVMAFGGKDFDGLLPERMAIAGELWKAGIRAEYLPKKKPKPQAQFNAAGGVPVAVMLGQDELAAGQVRVKAIQAEKEEGATKDRGTLISRSDLVQEVRMLLKAAGL